MKNVILIASLMFFWSCNTPAEKTGEDAHEEETASKEAAAHDHSEKDEDEGKKKPLSPRTATMSNVGANHIHIDYGSPGKRGRVIFGGLVGYGTVWATGAHSATFINFGQDVNVNGVDIAAGKYGLFTIPGESEWTIIISKDWDMHLADDYNETNDVVRVQSAVQKLDEVVESLTFKVEEIDESKGTVAISWDDASVSFEVQNQ